MTSSSDTMRPRAVSTRKMRPGCSRSLSTMSSGGMSSTPTSDAMIDQVVLRHVVARRPEAVAVEHRADHRAVGERDRRRAVPRLHQRRVVLVERLAARRDIVSWFCHGSGIIIRIACGSDRPGHDEELEHVVERRRVAAALADDRQDLLQVVAEAASDWSSPSRARIQLMLPVSVLISPLCAMKRYGCASGHDGNVFVLKRWCTSASADSQVRIRQIGKHRLDLAGREHALVDQRVARQADDVEELAATSSAMASASTACSMRLRMTYSFRSNARARRPRPPDREPRRRPRR